MPVRQERLKQHFGSDERGSVAILFSLMFLAFALLAGAAVDYGRIAHSKSQMITAVDAASLAAGKALLTGQASDAEIEQLAIDYLRANTENYDIAFADLGTPEVVIDRAAGTVTINIDAEVPMTLMKLGGFDAVDIPVTATTVFEQKDIELGMALDVTGSMWGSKIADLKLAAKDLIDILLPDGGSTNTVRIGLAPYATSINAGSYADVVTEGASSKCVHERGGSEKFTDAAPVGTDKLGYTSGVWCPSAEIRALTDNKNDLKNDIDAYSANGWTAGHLGAAWAWYLVSPTWASIWPAASEPVAYNEPETIKAIILMTDGQFNTEYVSGNGNSSTQAAALCTQMKAEGVVVYSIAFQAPSSAANLLANCASSPDHYFNAANGEELRVSFQAVASHLTNLRISN